jgi:hypothetical protein
MRQEEEVKRDKLPVSEADLQQAIVSAARKLGYLYYHTFDSRRSTEGFPDLVLVHDGKKRVVWIECKSETGVVSIYQTAWHDSLAKCDAEIYVVRPVNLDEIIEILMLAEKPTVAQRKQYESAVVYEEV